MKLRDLFFCIFCSYWLQNFGQDAHWSQFNDNQLFQSPAHTGQFDGDFRLIGNYREQWRSVTIPYRTCSISLDFKYKNGALAFW